MNSRDSGSIMTPTSPSHSSPPVLACLQACRTRPIESSPGPAHIFAHQAFLKKAYIMMILLEGGLCSFLLAHHNTATTVIAGQRQKKLSKKNHKQFFHTKIVRFSNHQLCSCVFIMYILYTFTKLEIVRDNYSPCNEASLIHIFRLSLQEILHHCHTTWHTPFQRHQWHRGATKRPSLGKNQRASYQRFGLRAAWLRWRQCTSQQKSHPDGFLWSQPGSSHRQGPIDL